MDLYLLHTLRNVQNTFCRAETSDRPTDRPTDAATVLFFSFGARSQNCEKRLLDSTSLSVCPHVTTQLPLDGFSWNLILECFSKTCGENYSPIKIGQEYRVLYMKQTDIHFWLYLAQFFLEWEMFQTKVVGKLKTHFVFSNPPPLCFRKSCRLWDNVKKYCREGQATDDNTAHAHCMLGT